MEDLYESVAADLRRLIQQGRWKPGDRLPTELELKEAHEVSRTTVRSALGLLRAEGWIVTHPSKGSIVQDRVVVRRRYSPEHPRGGPVTDLHGVPLEGVRMDIYRVEPVTADADLAAWLEVPEGAEVTVRRRRWFLNGQPLMLWDSYFPRYLVQGTPLDGPAGGVPQGSYAALDDLGMRPKVFTESVAGRKPTEEERMQLGIGDAWLFEVRRRSRDAHGLTIEGLMIRCAQDRNLLTFEDIEIPEEVDLT